MTTYKLILYDSPEAKGRGWQIESFVGIAPHCFWKVVASNSGYGSREALEIAAVHAALSRGILVEIEWAEDLIARRSP